MKASFAIVFASVYGLSLRLFFGFFQDFMGIMTLSFLIIGPAVIGYLTVFLLPAEK